MSAVGLFNEMAIYPSKLSVFCLGFTVGIVLAFVVTLSKNKTGFYKRSSIINEMTDIIKVKSDNYDQWLSSLGFSTHTTNFKLHDLKNYSSESHVLKEHINILCVMFIKNINNAYAAINTWMKKCNDIKFFSTKPVKYLEVTAMEPKNSWHYLCDVIRHINQNYKDFMWTLFVNDDVFAIPENLRRYVFNKNFLEPYYFGHTALFWNEHYNIAQAGYVLSKGTIKMLANKFTSSDSCEKSGKYWKNEDYHLGKYLGEMGVTPHDTRDQLGRGRFHLFTPPQLVAEGSVGLLTKYWKTSVYPVTQGFNCCSPHSVTFQVPSKSLMYFYYYILYNVHIGKETTRFKSDTSRSQSSVDQVWEQFVLDELGPDANLSAITPEKYYNLWKNKIDSPNSFNEKLRALFLGDSNE